jgi:hypothetical protein
MEKAEEHEARRLRGGVALSVRTLESKVDHSCLVRVQTEAEPCQPLAQNPLDTHAVEEVIKRHDEVVAVANERARSFHARNDVLLPPLVDHVVQVDVGEQR